MIECWAARWLQAPLWLRIASFLLAAALLSGLLWLCWLHPAQRQQQTLNQQQRQQTRRYDNQLAALHRLPSLSALRRQIAQCQQPQERATRPRFSLPALLAQTGAGLEHWYPAPQGGELAVTLSWPQFAELLRYLNTLQPPIEIPRFSLKRAEAQLKLQLELRYAH